MGGLGLDPGYAAAPIHRCPTMKSRSRPSAANRIGSKGSLSPRLRPNECATRCGAKIPGLLAASPDPTTLRIEYSTAEALESDFGTNLSKNRVFVPGVLAGEERTPALVVLERLDNGERFEWRGEVVWICREGPSTGTGVELVDLEPTEREALDRFLHPREEGSAEQAPGRALNLHDKIRALSAVEREKVARSGTLPERVALERHFGGVVWEGLLQNPQLTVPEVVRIAKNGGLPKPLASVIVSNPAWLGQPEIRRALLGNPRVDGLSLDRVVKAMPRAECAQVARSPAYRPAVRNLARRLSE